MIGKQKDWCWAQAFASTSRWPLPGNYARYGAVSEFGLKLKQVGQGTRAPQLHLKTPNVEQQVMYLSGGGQQKVVLAKWLSADSKVFYP